MSGLKNTIERLVNFTDEDAVRDAYDWYDWLMIITVFISLVPLGFRENNIYFYYIEVIATCIFIIDYILRWITSPSRSSHKDRWMAYLLYPITPSAIIDLITILPIFVSVNGTVRVLRLWRMVRILRVVRLFRYYEPLQMLINVFRKKSKMLLTIVSFAVFYILVTALIMFNVEDPITSEGNHFFDTYWDAIYWATCTLTTVGYGDIYPISTWGRIISMVSALVGIAIIALPSSILTAGYLEEVEEEKRKKKEL